MAVSQRAVGAITAVLVVLFPVSGWAVGGFDPSNLAWQVPMVAANTLPLLLVNRNPLIVVVFFSIAYPIWLSSGGESHILQSLPTLLAMYTLGSWDRPLRIRAIGLLAPMWMVGAAVSGWWDAEPLELSFVALVFSVVWGMGATMAARRRYILELEAKTASLEQAERRLADQAVTEERNRIARELHDVIAHAMSVITIQAGVGAHLIDTKPSQASQALAVIERTGREALDEMRRMLTVLKHPDQSSLSGPQPGLSDLPDLIQQLTEAGVRADLEQHGAACPLPAGLDLAAYRVAQEGLTNVVKHAPGARATVRIQYEPDELAVEVVNTLRVPVTSSRPGQGLRGMRERVRLYDGKLDAAPVGDEFRLRATFPLEAGP